MARGRAYANPAVQTAEPLQDTAFSLMLRFRRRRHQFSLDGADVLVDIEESLL